MTAEGPNGPLAIEPPDQTGALPTVGGLGFLLLIAGIIWWAVAKK